MLQAKSSVDRRLLAHWSELLLCSRCFSRGVRRAVPQLITPRQKPRALCGSCAEPRAGH